jgi:aminoglycoside 3-N-acetyltransferase
VTEETAIAAVDTPRTRLSLAADLTALGLHPGMIVLVHSSLSSLGWTCGGAVAVIQALMDVLTPQGTLVMPAHSSLSDPAHWENPPVPEAWWPVIRDHMPAYDPRLTPTWGMGQIAELFRNWPDVLRSDHPADSFAAWGRCALEITSGHSLEFGLGEASPLARIYNLEGWVLLLGVDYDSNTSFHLAEHRAPGLKTMTQAAPITVDGRRVWKSYTTADYSVNGFAQIGEALETTGAVHLGKVGSATARFFPQRPAVDLAARWLSDGRRA